MILKHCRKCNTDKPIAEFYRNMSYCKACKKAYDQSPRGRERTARYKAAHIDDIRQRDRQRFTEYRKATRNSVYIQLLHELEFEIEFYDGTAEWLHRVQIAEKRLNEYKGKRE